MEAAQAYATYMGIDPGKGGGIAVLDECGTCLCLLKLKDATERDVYEFVSSNAANFAFIEKVHSTPQMGVVSAFSFGRSLGFLRGVLSASGIPFDEVLPQKWQREIGCLSKGEKNTTKAKAQQLFPAQKVTHAVADALLIAEYCRRIRH